MSKMRCTVCGSGMRPLVTQLPFRISDACIVIIKELPVLDCQACREFLLEDTVMARVDQILASVEPTAELEVVRFAA